MLVSNVYAACIQEHWRNGHQLMDNRGITVIGAGLTACQQTHRGSQGVGIVLSAAATKAWKACGSLEYTNHGARVCAVRFKVKDLTSRKEIWMFLVSAYSPIGCAPQTEHDDYLHSLDECIAHKQPGDMLLIGTDANASLGRAEAKDEYARGSQSVGPFGEPHVNDAGLRLRAYIETRSLTAVSTHFQKPHYATWKHPCSGNMHQVDHFIVESHMMTHVSDCGITEALVDSDHRAIECIRRVTARKVKQIVTPRQTLAKLDFSVLRGEGEDADDIKREFCGAVMAAYNKLSPDTEHFTRLTSALQVVSASKMPKKKRASPGWFEQSKEVLLPLIAARNTAMTRWMSSSKARTRSVTRDAYMPLRNARKQLRLAIVQAKNEWILGYVSVLNAGNARGGSKAGWDAVKVLKAGLMKTKQSLAMAMQTSTGVRVTSAEEKTAVFKEHFEGLYGRTPEGDPSIIDSIPDHPIIWALGDVPTGLEKESAVRKLRNTAPGKSGLPAAAWKALMATTETKELVFKIVDDVWIHEKQPDEFNIGMLAILPKKGDLSLPGNYRGIMMLEVAYKLVAIIVADRCNTISKDLDHENQVGFRPGRGCSDGVFNLRTAIRKRREHGLETWVFFLDLVKAFDRVPRAMLWRVLEKLGAPPKLIALLKALHASVLVEFEIDGVSCTIESIIGVKQGDVLGPVLFVLYMAAVMMSWRSKHTDKSKLCIFHSRADSVLAGRKTNVGRRDEEFAVQDVEYTDDTTLLFPGRSELEENIPLVYVHFFSWGMEVHSGRAGQFPRSKSEAAFFAAHPSTYLEYSTFTSSDGIPADLSPIQFGDNYEVPVVEKFKLLGSCVAANGSDETDVTSRIKSAGAAFNALGRCLFRAKAVCLKAKRAVYNGLVLAILLYGCESWALTEKLLNRLRTFHAACVRGMCRVTLRHMWERRVSTAELERQLDIHPIEVFLYLRQLAWAGHVAPSRMDWNVRMPRKLLSSWVKHDACGAGKRPACGQMMSYWRSLQKGLRRANVNLESWYESAQDRDAWRAVIRTIK